MPSDNLLTVGVPIARAKPAKPEKLYSVSVAAKILAQPGLPPDPIASQIRTYAQLGLLKPAGQKGSGRSAHKLYPEDQLLTAKVLSVLADCGFSDHSILHAAAKGLLEWPTEDEYPARTPGQFIIDEWGIGVDWWAFELGVHRHDVTGDRQVRARIRNAQDQRGTSYGLPDDYTELALTTIDLGPYLTRIFSSRQGMH